MASIQPRTASAASQRSDDAIAQVTRLRPWTAQSAGSQDSNHGNTKPKNRPRPRTTNLASWEQREARGSSGSLYSDRQSYSRPSSSKTPLTPVGPPAYGKSGRSQYYDNEGEEPEPWSMTEVGQRAESDSEEEEEEVLTMYTPSIAPRLLSGSGDEDDDDEDEQEEAEDVGIERADSTPLKTESLKNWLDGLEVESDEYDTDLEEDFPPEPEPPPDATGANLYQEECKKNGIIPVSYLVRNMGEGNLRMRHHYLGGHGTKPLAEALKRNTVCEEIDLSDNYLDGEGAIHLADMLKENMFVVNLNVSDNFMKSKGAEAFAEMLESNTTLKTLSLQGNQLTDRDALRLAEALKANMSLGVLDLSHNRFGEMGGVYLGMGLSNNIGLADLDVSWNGIRQKGAIAIAKALQKNASLETLDISWNGMAHTGTAALAQSLRTNTSLRVLDISNNRITTEAAKKLGQAIGKNNGMETLLMGMNPIGQDGMDAIIKGISTNPTLKLVGLEDISVSPSTQQKIEELTKQRDIMIMYTSGSPQQSKMNQTILAVFDRFISENADRMEDLFLQMDKDKSGNITLEEFKYGLKDFGLRLTSKQLDQLLDELDADRSGTIEFEELMNGSTLIQQEKVKMERMAKEARILQQSQQQHMTQSHDKPHPVR